MRDIKQARAMLRMAHKDFAALTGMARDTVALRMKSLAFMPSKR